MKLTEWFPADVKPVRKGVYELEGLAAPFLYWDGFSWYGAAFLARESRKTGGVRYLFGHGYPAVCRWRGLAVKPK